MSNTSVDREIDEELQILLAVFAGYLWHRAHDRIEYPSTQDAVIYQRTSSVFSEILGRIALAEPGSAEAKSLKEVQDLWNENRRAGVRFTINTLRQSLRVHEGAVSFHETDSEDS
jgi:hypothetical protein